MYDFDMIHPDFEGVLNTRLSPQDIDIYLNSFEKSILSTTPKKNLLADSALLFKQGKLLQAQQKKAWEIFSKIPLSSAYLQWIKETLQQEVIKSTREAIYTLEHAKLLFSKGFIPIRNSKGQIWTLKDTSKQDDNDICELIRCHREWPMRRRNALANTYRIFLLWLNRVTCGYVVIHEDNERQSVCRRRIDYFTFLGFLDHLNPNSQLVAKLLYYGGSRTLDEILQLDTKQVDFQNRLISFGLQLVPYPRHVFEDIRALSEKKKVFTGRQGAALNAATVFRHFKEAALKCKDLPPSFSSSMLTMDM